MHNLTQYKSHLAVRLVLYIFLFSSLVTLVSTGVQLFFEYKRDIAHINTTVDQIRQAHVSTIISSLWVFDLTMLETELQGISELPDVGYVSIDKENKNIVSVGGNLDDHFLSYEFPLTHNHRGQELTLGTLKVDVSLLGVYKRLKDRVIIILATQAFKTFLVSSFTFFLFFFLVGRHLNTMADFARNFSFKRLDTPLELKRIHKGREEQDELHLVESAINDMRVNLIQEIDALRASQDALLKSENRFRSLVDNIPGVVCRTELKFPWKVIYISELVEKHTGYPVAEFFNGNILYGNLIHPDDYARVEKVVSEKIKRGNPYEIEYRLTHQDGIVRWMFETGRAVYDENRKPIWRDGVILDITEKKTAEQLLGEKDLLLKAIIENTSDAIYFKDFKGRYVLANSATFKAIGKLENEVIGKNDFELFPEESAKIIKEADLSVINSNKPVLVEERLETSFGETYWQANKSPLRDNKGNPLGVVGISRNITDMKKDQAEKEELKKRLIQAQKLEAIGLMASGVAHDLNNILSGIVGYPELIIQGLPQESKVRKPLEAIQQAGSRAAAVVADLLTIARGAATTRKVHDVNSLIREYLNSPEGLKTKSLYPNITCQSKLKAEHSLLLCSSVHVKKCIMNLVTNAMEAITNGGLVQISTENRYIDNAFSKENNLEAGEFIILSVRDNGSGIPKSYMGHIFDPFYTRKEMGRSGTGLGLTVVWNTMEDHSGKVIVESSGTGTCFQLYFPVTQDNEKDSTENDSKENFIGTDEHILVVDDEPQIRDLASQMLSRLGYKVDSICSGELAIKFVKNNPVDLIVLDMQMEPGMNGYQTYKEVLKLYPDQKAIVSSGFSESDDVKAAIELGVNGLIQKPYSMDQFGRAVKQALQS